VAKYAAQSNNTMRQQTEVSDRNFPAACVRPRAALLAQAVLVSLLALSASMKTVAASPSFTSLHPSDSGAGLMVNDTATISVESAPLLGKPVRRAMFGQEEASRESQKLADWVVDSANNGKLPFIVIDKVQARIFVFNPGGQLRGAAAVLLGMAVGDDSVPGIGQRKLSSILPNERTTAAGRFVASLDRDINGKELLWVDYDSSLSLHRVVKGQPNERRAERLATPTPLDNRVSFGCINVPVKFYDDVVSPAFTGTDGIVYILPETRSAREVFGSYDVLDPSARQASAQFAPGSTPAVR